VPPEGFDERAFRREQQVARVSADRLLRALSGAWERWQDGGVANGQTIDEMSAHLTELRELCQRHPRLYYWAQLGGYFMNIHKLLENTLFECELCLGHALTFGGAEVRRFAEQNLAGCYQKRLLEAARFMWMDGGRRLVGGGGDVETRGRDEGRLGVGREQRRHLGRRGCSASRVYCAARHVRRRGCGRGASARRGGAAAGEGGSAGC
jgi:hypothetical protein